MPEPANDRASWEESEVVDSNLPEFDSVYLGVQTLLLHCKIREINAALWGLLSDSGFPLRSSA
jgi:hypothetical protein